MSKSKTKAAEHKRQTQARRAILEDVRCKLISEADFHNRLYRWQEFVEGDITLIEYNNCY